MSGPGGEHMKFAGELRLSADRRYCQAAENDTHYCKPGAEEITLRLTAATDYNI